MIKKHFKRLMSVALLLLTSVSVSANSQVNDDLQAYLDNLAATSPAKAAVQGRRKRARRREQVIIPVDIPVVDLSQFSSATNRTTTLEIKTDVRLTNGTISNSTSFTGGGCLLKVSSGATVYLDATASVNAALSSSDGCLTAIGVYGGSNVTQYGDITAPDDGEGYAVYLDTEYDTYTYVSGTTRGKIRRVKNEPSTIDYNGRTWMIGRYAPIQYDFADINAAMASTMVKDGDILLVERTLMYGDQTVTKAVKIVGNNNYWRSDLATISGNLNIENMNVTVMGILVTGTINVRDDNAHIERCSVSGGINADEDYICDFAVIDNCYARNGVDDTGGYDWTVTNSVSDKSSVPMVVDMPWFSKFTVPTSVDEGTSLPVSYVISNVTQIAYMEYFWDEDPGWTKGTPLHNGNNYFSTETGNGSLPVATTNLAPGKHQLVVRARSASGYWATSWVRTVTITEPAPPKPVFTEFSFPDKGFNNNFKISFSVKAEGGDINWVEYYWDTDPGYQKGKYVAGQGDDTGNGITRTDYIIECKDMTGSHTLYLRARCGSEWTEVKAENIILSYDDSPYAFNGYNGRKWIIGNYPPIRYDFADINAAMASDEVKDGDILQIDRVGYPQSGVAQTVSKKVKIVGNLGYMFDNYITSDINITSGNVTLAGLWVSGNVNIRENSVNIDRCRVSGKISNNSEGIIRNVSITGCVSTIDQSNSYNWMLSDNSTSGRPTVVTDVPVFSTITVPSSAVADESFDVTYQLTNSLNGIAREEYFWDEDPGWGNATPLKFNQTTVSTAGLAPGSHTLVIRAKSSHSGYWATSVHNITISEPVVADPKPVFTVLTVPTEGYNDNFKITFTVVAEGSKIDWVEYFWDTDPDYKKGRCIVDQGHDSGSGISRTDYQLDCADMTGYHTLYIRALCGTEWTAHEFKNIILSYDDTPYAFNGYNGHKWIIGNSSPIRYDFADINAAMASDLVHDGDILQVDRVGYPQSDVAQTVSKKVKIVGNLGYTFDNYITSDINITSGNVSLEGLWVSGNVNIRENSVNIDRCWVHGKISNNSGRIIRNVKISNSNATQGVDNTLTYNWTITDNLSGRPPYVIDVPVLSELSVPVSANAGESLSVEYSFTNVNTISRIEYFWDTDPGWTKATSIGFVENKYLPSTKNNPQTVSTSNLSAGNHTLVIRALSSTGYWVTSQNTVTIAEPVIVDPKPVFTVLTVPTEAENDEFKITFDVYADGGLIDWIEYFWDTDPGYKRGRCIVDQGHDGGNGISRTDYQIDCNSMYGSHTFYIRALCGSEWTEHRFENINLIVYPVDAGDLAALKLISDNLGLNGYWNFANEGRYESDFPGVKFVNHRVTEIDLSNHGYQGTLSTDWMPSLPEITYLNLSRNNITGDVTPLVTRMPKLKTLDLSYNRITQVSGKLPSVLTSLNLRSQMRVFGNNTSGANEGFVDMMTSGSLSPVTATLGSRVALTLPSLFYYDATNNDNSLRADVQVVDIKSPTTVYGTYSYSGNGQGWQFTPKQNESINLQADTRVALVTNGEWQRWSACPAILGVILGDANIDGSVNILDVQHTLNYILATAQPFNLWAANTYVDKIINVQDIVCTINIILGLPNAARQANLARGTGSDEDDATENVQFWVYEQNERIAAYTTTEVAAVDIEIDGVKTDEVSLLLNNRDFHMVGQNTATGSRYVIYSPTGAVIPAGKTTALLSMSRSARPVAVNCADAEARKVKSAIGQTTAVSTVTTTACGTTVVETRLAPGIYIVRTTDADGESKTVKILKK